MSSVMEERIAQIQKNEQGQVAVNWSAALEHEEYETDRNLIISDSIRAVERTAAGCWVNLVTAAGWGNPEAYVVPVLKEKFGDSLRAEYIDQCDCGGYVLRVWK